MVNLTNLASSDGRSIIALGCSETSLLGLKDLRIGGILIKLIRIRPIDVAKWIGTFIMSAAKAAISL